MRKPQLPPEVAAKYDLVNWKGGHRQIFGRYGVVDISTLTLKQADTLYRQGFSKLKEKPKVTRKKETE